MGITRRENSRGNFFLISQVVSEIEKQLRNLSLAKERNRNYALNQNKIIIQSKNIISLAATFDTVKLRFID